MMHAAIRLRSAGRVAGPMMVRSFRADARGLV
jgi:hypothetical protein